MKQSVNFFSEATRYRSGTAPPTTKKKPDPSGPSFLVNPEKLTNHNRIIIFLNFTNHLNRRETIKLTVAPTTARIIVFAISSERMLGAILNKVPEAVPTRRVTLVSISCSICVILS
jgi:hypothetical protein